jgi:hypothetical protein
MSDNISFIESEQIENKIQMILRQTDYTEEIAREKLKEYKYDHILVIKSYFGITEKKIEVAESVNQEIYKQMRYKLDGVIRDYNFRKENNDTKLK